MGRSVSRPSNAQVVCYRTLEQTYENDEGETVENEFAFDDMLEDLRETSKSEWKSLSDCDEWLDREDHAVLENNFVYIGLSEYCGLVSIWIVAKEPQGYSDDYKLNLASRWIKLIEPKFRKYFDQYRKLGTMSNGEGVYQKIER